MSGEAYTLKKLKDALPMMNYTELLKYVEGLEEELRKWWEQKPEPGLHLEHVIPFVDADEYHDWIEKGKKLFLEDP